MQTLDCVSGLHNFLKFSQPPLVFRWEYVNTEKKVLFGWAVTGFNEVVQAYLLSSKKTIYYITIPLRHRKLFHSQIILALGSFCRSTY